jgi:hypothetical protein
VDYAGAKFTLSSASPYRNKGTTGRDLGANMKTIDSVLANVIVP